MPHRTTSEPERRLLVAVTGADGAGKTTITRGVVEELRSAGHAVATSDRWDVVGDGVDYPSARFLADDVPLLRECVAEMPAQSRLLFLLWTMHLSLTGLLQRAGNTVVLTDSYWMKHAASETVYGLEPLWVRSVCAGMPDADVVVYLKVAPELAWRRIGSAVNAYECGMDRSRSEFGFLQHQRAIQDMMDRWAREDGWLVVDAARPIPEVQREVAGIVSKAISSRPSGVVRLGRRGG